MRKNLQTIAVVILLFTATPLSISAQNDGEMTEITVTNEKGEKEIIGLPGGMTLDVDSLLNVYNTRTYLALDDDCNLPDVNPPTDKETIKARLKRIPSIIEMPYNDAVQQCIDRYSGRLRRSISIMLGTQNLYMPIFEEALEAYGLPLELKYLPIVESALNPNAVSRAGATGLWQFMITTGKQYGLEVSTLVDERRDPVKSSYAAAHFLSDLYKVFGDWNLVIAAYNCGPENVNKAIHRSNGSTDYWQIYPYLPKETRGYVPAFIAANYIMTYYCEHNICPMRASLPVRTDTVVVNRDVHFEQIAAVLGIGKDQINDMNPQYRRDIIPGNSSPSTLRLTAEQIINFIDNEQQIYAFAADSLLSKREEVTVNKTATKAASSSKAKWVTIRRGDTLSTIAKRNGTTVARLKQLNNIKGTNIVAGKKLRVR